MATMYKFYQLVGGDEAWTPVQAQIPLDDLKPTFVTALAVDMLITKDTPKEDIRRAKYQGPMYFDLDSDGNIQESIDSGKELVANLMSYDLTEQDIQIYLSGKKGLHVIVPEVCFQEKPAAVQGLVQVYKEIALRFAVDAMDFRVYTAGRGRQFRTCFNQRENGNYKVPISYGELQSLTPESYAQLCSQPRSTPLYAPKWRPKFALVYDEALQKVGKIKPRRAKPVTPGVLQDALPVYSKLASGKVKAEVGFNILAMQLALYARECKWTEDEFIKSCAGVIANHESDGSRYNTPRKRDAELRRMFWYVDDNSNLDFGREALKSCAPKVKGESREDSGLPSAPSFDSEEGQEAEEDYDDMDYAGVYKAGGKYLVSKGEDGDQAISNFTLEDITVLYNLKETTIYKVTGRMNSRGKGSLMNAEVSFGPTSLSSSSGVQNTFAKYGGSFFGNDTHARGLYNLMIRETKHSKFVLTTEGVNCIRVRNPHSKDPNEPAQEYTVWADKDKVICGTEMPFDLMFLGDPDPRGLAKTDLTTAPEFSYYVENGEEERVFTCLENLFSSHTPETMGKMVGWAAACFYAPMFQLEQEKFPLLHVYGPAGSGKTETIRGVLRMFYHHAEAMETSPNSTLFSIQQQMASTGSIPLFVDEYKPHEMDRTKLNAMRAVFRDAYNAKSITRGGGNRNNKDDYNALNSLKMEAPVIFAAEAPETETAIVERSVMVSFKRLSGRAQANAYRSALAFYQDEEPLTSLGLELAQDALRKTAKEAMEPFDKYLAWANHKYLPGPDDAKLVEEGKMTEAEYKLRAGLRPRNVFAATVALFGMQMIRNCLIAHFGKERVEERLGKQLKMLSTAVFIGMDSLSSATVPEFVKVLGVMADMSKLGSSDPFALLEGIDYNLSEINGEAVLVLAPAQAYRKYRAYSRHTNSVALFPGEDAFRLALQEIPQFIKAGDRTQRLTAATVYLNLDDLYRAGCPAWSGKPVMI